MTTLTKTFIDSFGNAFERNAVALISFATGITLISLTVEGPLFLHHITYKTASVINNQIIGQDLVNLSVLSPMLIVGGIMLLMKHRISAYLLLMTPLYLIYFVLCYTIGWKWSSPTYTGNSETSFLISHSDPFLRFLPDDDHRRERHGICDVLE